MNTIANDNYRNMSLTSFPSFLSNINIEILNTLNIYTLGQLFDAVDNDEILVNNAQQYKEITGAADLLRVKYVKNTTPLISFDFNGTFDDLSALLGLREKTIDYLLSHNIKSFSGFVIFINNINKPEYDDIEPDIRSELVDKCSVINNYYKTTDLNDIETIQKTLANAEASLTILKMQEENLKGNITYGSK